jgi:hypothetical protein
LKAESSRIRYALASHSPLVRTLHGGLPATVSSRIYC